MKKLILIITVVVMMAGSANAYLYTMDFANSTLDLGSSTQIDLTNQYASFGLTFDHVYRYADDRDPWDEMQYGISNGWVADGSAPGASGTVYFSELTNYVAFDWWTIDLNPFYLAAWSADDVFLGGQFYGNGQYQHSISATGIDHISFHDDGGFTAISTLTYERTAIPEPATMLLVGLGMAGIGIIRRKRS